MQFLKANGPELVGAFKTPSLRNVGRTAPYMHAGQFGTLAAVVAHYNKPTPPFYDRAQHPSRPHFDIVPLGLSAEEQAALVAFLKSLDSI
jgi:cytochrome c peroxidase